MKQLIISAVSLFLCSLSGLSQSTEPSQEATNQRNSEVVLKQLDQRKNFHWHNGTTATPTGREAAPVSIGGSYVSHRQVDASLKTPSYSDRLRTTTSSQLSKLDQRKHFKWKDGTTATPTGHQATPTGGGYASLGQPKNDKPVSKKSKAKENDQ